MYQFNPVHEFTQIEQLYKRGEALLHLPEYYSFRVSEGFSRWTSAQHLVHLARTNMAILESIDELIAGRGVEGSPTRLGAFLLLWGRIPRRRAQAAESIQPPRDLGRTQAINIWRDSAHRLGQLRGRCSEIRAAQARHEHYIFGALSATQWVRFMAIHTNHHLKIGEDILLIRSGGH